MFKVGVAAAIDFALQGALGFIAFGSDTVLVVQLANAFIVGTLVTYFIVFADRADRDLAPKMGMPYNPSS